MPKKAGFACLAYLVNKTADLERLLKLDIDGVLTDEVHKFKPDRREDGSHSTYEGRRQPDRSREHCTRCHGPYVAPSDDTSHAQVNASMTKAKAGTEYLRYIQANRVTVPKPTK